MKQKLYILDPSRHITGAFRAAQNEANILKDDYDVILVLPTISTIEKKELEVFSKVIYLPIYDLRKSFISILVYFPMLFWSGLLLRSSLYREQCNILQVNDYYLMQGVIAKLFGYRGKIFTWVRIDPSRYGSFFSKYWLKLDYWASDKIIAVSKFIEGKLPKNKKNILIYDAVQNDDNTIKVISLDKHKKKITFIGNYTFGKGQQYAIEAFMQLSKKYDDIELHFYGGTLNMKKNQVYKNRLIKRVKELKLEDKVYFHSFVANPLDVIQSSYMILNFSESESFSLTCLEASFAGKSVVATKCGGPEEIIVDNETGFLVEKGNIAQMSEAIEILLKDSVKNKLFGEKGKLHVQTIFSKSKFKDIIEKMFEGKV